MPAIDTDQINAHPKREGHTVEFIGDEKVSEFHRQKSTERDPSLQYTSCYKTKIA
jgi:hypothetical protein